MKRAKLTFSGVLWAAMTGCSLVPQAMPIAGPSPVAVQLARVRPLSAYPITDLPQPLELAKPGLLQEVLVGHATRLAKDPNASGLLVVAATADLGATSTGASVDLRLDGVQPNEPPATAHFGLLDVASPTQRDFWVIRANLPAPFGKPFDEVSLSCKPVGSGRHAQIYLDQALPQDDATLAALATLQTAFDERIYPTVTHDFGDAPNPGRNGDGRVAIVVSPEVSGHGQSSALAYFGRRDLQPRDAANPATAHSNEAEVLFVDSAHLADDRQIELRTSVAHEFQHLVNYHHKYDIQHLVAGEDRWLDEGLAMLSSARCGYGPDVSQAMHDHMADYLAMPYAMSLTDWSGNPTGEAYGMAFMWLSYLVDRFDSGLIAELVASSQVGKANMDAVLRKRGTSYVAAFEDFSVALAADGLMDLHDPRYRFVTWRPRGSYPFGDLAGPAAVRVSPDGVHVDARPDLALLFHFRVGDSPDGPVVHAAGATGRVIALVP